MVNNEQFLIEPDFNDLGTAAVLEFQVGAINALADAEFNSHVGFYQRTFGTYGYMRFNSLGEYVMHYPSGSPLLLQPHNSCAWTPQGNFSFQKKTIQPEKAKINVEDCYDEHFGGTFERFIQYGDSAAVGLSQGGVALTDAMTRLIVGNTTLGARAALTAGGLFTDVTDSQFAEGTPTSIREAFMRTAMVGKGWINAARNLAVADADKYGHLDNSLIANGDVSNDGEDFTGDVLALFDARVGSAKRKLKRAVESGGRGGFGGRNIPIWIVSTSIVSAVYGAYLDQGVATATNRPRIAQETYQVPTGRGTTAPIMVYTIDGVPVIPAEEIEVFTDYLKGTPHFDYLTLTGVIQLGGSFGAIPERGTNNVAVRVQQSQRNEDLGKTTYLAHMLLASGFNDTDYLAGGYRFNEPA